ncbi:uncharacterized protein LOC103859047 [Brassica rapa]|uniref:uncharacterized protein LOC103859047 n=1 Tax=Brassica campestris TaxID=3711 RepID=UPI00142D35EC|nr:uncharacterized protein LOC103859047 [Brassica rapa]
MTGFASVKKKRNEVEGFCYGKIKLGSRSTFRVSLLFSLAAIETEILLSPSHLLRDRCPVDEPPSKSSPSTNLLPRRLFSTNLLPSRLLSTAHLLRHRCPDQRTSSQVVSVDDSPPTSSLLDESPPKSSPLDGFHPEASLCDWKVKGLLGEVRFDHQDCISKEIEEKQPFPPQFKFSDYKWVLITATHNLHRMRRLVGQRRTVTTMKSNLSFSKTKLSYAKLSFTNRKLSLSKTKPLRLCTLRSRRLNSDFHRSATVEVNRRLLRLASNQVADTTHVEMQTMESVMCGNGGTRL